MIFPRRRERCYRPHSCLSCVTFIAFVASALPIDVQARETKLVSVKFVVVSSGQSDERSSWNEHSSVQPVPSCFVFVPPSDSPQCKRHPELRRWLEAQRGNPSAKQHRFRLEAGKIVPAAAVLRVGDAVNRYLTDGSTLSLEMSSNSPIGPGPSSVPAYTFQRTETLPITISAASEAATESHALVLDHEIGAVSDENGNIVISGLPPGMDIPMRVCLPAAESSARFQCDLLDIKSNGLFVVNVDSDAEFRLVLAQRPGQQTPTLGEFLPTCVRVSGQERDANQLLLSPTTMTIGLGPCSEVCEITVEQALKLLRECPSVRELELWGWPVAITECQELMRGIASLPNVSRLSLIDLRIDETILSLVADNPQLCELALRGRCSFPESKREDFAWVFDAIAQSNHLERLEISRHSEIRIDEISRLRPMPRLRHFVFDGPIDKPSVEGIARLNHLVSLELPEYDVAEYGLEDLANLKNLENLMCSWSAGERPILLRELSGLQSLTLLADPRDVDWAVISSLPKLQAVNIRRGEVKLIENSLGMKFVPIRMPRTGKPDSVLYMQQSEVTSEQYRRFKTASGLAVTEAEKTPSNQPLAPQDFDSWRDASQFIHRLNQWDKQYTYRMPTESEWEFACTGEIGGPPLASTTSDASADAAKLFLTRQAEPNQFGLYDMLGVYGEYCSDPYDKTNDSELAQIPQGPNSRVVRGMRQPTDRPHTFRFSSDHRFSVAVEGSTPHYVIGVRLVLQPSK